MGAADLGRGGLSSRREPRTEAGAVGRGRGDSGTEPANRPLALVGGPSASRSGRGCRLESATSLAPVDLHRELLSTLDEEESAMVKLLRLFGRADESVSPAVEYEPVYGLSRRAVEEW